MKTSIVNSAHASCPLDSSGPSTGNSLEHIQASGCSSTTSDKPSPRCVQDEAGRRTPEDSSCSLTVDGESFQFSASDSLSSQRLLQDNTAPLPTAIHAVKPSVSALEVVSPHFNWEQRSGQSLEDSKSHKLFLVPEKEVLAVLRFSQSAAVGAAPVALTEPEPTERKYQTVASCSDLTTATRPLGASVNNFHPAECPLTSTVLSNKTAKNEVGLMVATKGRATSALPPHHENLQTDVQGAGTLCSPLLSCSASHESLGTVGSSTKKRPQAQQNHQQSRPLLHIQQHQQPPLQQQQPPIQQQQPPLLQRKHQCLVLQAQHTFPSLQLQQPSKTDCWQPSVLYEAQTLPTPEPPDCSSSLQQPHQLRTGPVLFKDTSHTLLLRVHGGCVDVGNASNCQLSQVPTHRPTQQLPCSFPRIYASYEPAVTNDPASTGGQAPAADQQAVVAVHAGESTTLQMAAEGNVPEVPVMSPLPGSFNARACDTASLVTDLPAYSKRPKTADVGEADFANVTSSVSSSEPTSTLHAAERRVPPLCLSTNSDDAGSLSQAGETRPCFAGAFSSRFGKASIHDPCLDTAQSSTTTTATTTASDDCGQHFNFGDLFACARTKSATFGGSHVPHGTLQCSRKTNLNVCPEAPWCQVKTENRSRCTLSLEEAASATASNQYSMEVDCTVTKPLVNVRARETRHRIKDHTDADEAGTHSPQACVSMPPFQETTGERQLAIPSVLEVERDPTYFTETCNEGGGSKSAVSGGPQPGSACATDTTGGVAASCSNCFSSLPSALAGGKLSREAPAVSAIEQRWNDTGSSTTCIRTTVELEQKADVAMPEKEHGSVLEGRIYWGKKRGPYDRPVRILLGDDTETSMVSEKERALTQCKISEEREANEKTFAVTTKSVHMTAELGSSSSMASTRATTPLTRPSNGSSSVTSPAEENPCAAEAVAVEPSLAAAPSEKAVDMPSSANNPQTQAAAEHHVSSPAPRRRLVRLCDNDEDIWNEWEGQSMLGEGVYGRVYLVRSRKTGEERAFKRMYLQLSRFASSRSNEAVGGDQEAGDSTTGMSVANGGLPAVVQREIASLKALQGVRNVITLEEVFIGSRRVYLSFPVIRGGSLSELLRRYAIWQEHLLTVHQTASSACTATSPGEDLRTSSSTDGSCDVSSSGHGCRSEGATDQCSDDSTSDCCDISRGSCPAPSRRDCCHTTRWDCRSSGKCDCSTSSNTSQGTCQLDTHSTSMRRCKCYTKVAGNTTQKCHLFPPGIQRDKVYLEGGREEQAIDMQSRTLGRTERELAVDAARTSEKIRIGGNCPAAENPNCDSSTQLGQKHRRTSTCSCKKEDEYPCCRSHEASLSLLDNIRAPDSGGTCLERCLSAAAAVCCCGCCTLRNGMDEEIDNEALKGSLLAPCSTFAASSSSHSSSVAAALHRLSGSSTLPSPRPFFSPPFSYPQMPPCGLPLPLAKSIVQAILRGVTACHERRIAHRDMKPDNILLDWVPQAPPSPPPPPPSPMSNRSASPCSAEQTCARTDQTRCCTRQPSCCTKQTGCCVKRHRCACKQDCRCQKVDYLSSGEGSCRSKETCCCGNQMCCRKAQRNDCGCSSHAAGCDADDGGRGPAAVGSKAARTLDVCKAARALLLRGIEAEGDRVLRREPEQAVGGRDVEAASESDIATTGKAEEGDANPQAEVDREVKSITVNFVGMEGQPKEAGISGTTKEKLGVCSKKREPTFCAASGENGESAGPRRRRCTKQIACAGDCDVELDAACSGRAGRGLHSKAPAASAGDAAEARAAPAATLTMTYAGIGRGSSAEGLSLSATSAEGNNSTRAAAALIDLGARNCMSRVSDGAGKGAASGREEHAGAAVEAALPTERDGRIKGQNKGDDGPEAGGGEICAVTAGTGSTEEEDGDGSNDSTSSGTAVAEEQEEAASDTQQSEDSLSTPEYPPLPTRLVIADFGLARTLPLYIPVSTSAPLTPAGFRARQKPRQQCRRKHQQTQFVLPAPAAVPSTRCTSSCSNSCWVGYNSGCCETCGEAKHKDVRMLGSLPTRPHGACACRTEAAAQEASSHEGHAEEVPLSGADSCTGCSKHWRSGRLGKWRNQKSALALREASCGGSTCSRMATGDASCGWWKQCNSASNPQHDSEESCCCCCDASWKGGDTTGQVTLPVEATLSEVDITDDFEEAGKTEETPEEQAEEGGKKKQDDTRQLSLSPPSTPLYSSATFCLSPEIITLNYRPLDVLLGSSSYSLCVDVWSVGCIFMELLTGCELIDGCTEFQCIVAIMRLFGNPWKKFEKDDSSGSKCSPCTQGIRSDGCVSGGDSAVCGVSSSCGRQSVSGSAQHDNVTESCGGHSKGRKSVAPCREASITSCCALPVNAPGEAEKSTSSTGRKRVLRGNKKPPAKSLLDRSSEWRFWSEALPAFQGEDRPLERILRECGRMDAVADPHLLDLAGRLLTVLPDRRITASEALLHPFFDDVRLEDQL